MSLVRPRKLNGRVVLSSWNVGNVDVVLYLVD